jgi:hypothetical protein
MINDFIMDENNDKYKKYLPFIEFFQGDFHKEMSDLKRYLADNSAFIEHLQDEKYEKELKNYNIGDGIESSFIKEILSDFNLIPTIANNSCVVILYSFFEYELFTISRLINSIFNSAKDSDYLTENGKIGGYFKYIKNAAGIDLKDLNKKWKVLKYFQKMRNGIVHNKLNLVYKEKDKDYKDWILKNEYITNDEINDRFL